MSGGVSQPNLTDKRPDKKRKNADHLKGGVNADAARMKRKERTTFGFLPI